MKRRIDRRRSCEGVVFVFWLSEVQDRTAKDCEVEMKVGKARKRNKGRVSLVGLLDWICIEHIIYVGIYCLLLHDWHTFVEAMWLAGILREIGTKQVKDERNAYHR